jgi:hypothetical protein
VQRIWDAAPHNAFTDLIRYQDRWFCTFREGERHVGTSDGRIRVITSDDGDTWESAALLSEEGVDLRDSKLSVTPDGRLMLVAGGSYFDYGPGNPEDHWRGMQPRVFFSEDGFTWSDPRMVFRPGEWIWRVTWHDGAGYGVSYGSPDRLEESTDWATLVKTTNGVDYEVVTVLDAPLRPNEGTIRFDGDTMILLQRRKGPAAIGVSEPPYTEWTWNDTGEWNWREVEPIGGPDFVILEDGTMWAAGREYDVSNGQRKDYTSLFRMTRESLKPVLRLPSGGDSSYPGMVLHDGLLWMSYYSSHEGKSSIYLARIRLP